MAGAFDLQGGTRGCRGAAGRAAGRGDGRPGAAPAGRASCRRPLAPSVRGRTSARVRSAPAALAVLLLLALAASARAGQDDADPAVDDDAFHRQATRALAHGDRDAAGALADARPSTDPAAAALRARLLIDRGRHDDAETLLTPAARAAPASPAGLALGRLLLQRGRPDQAAPFLQAVIAAGLRAPDGLAAWRGARAARAAGDFRQANAFLRLAARLRPDDPAVHTTWGDLFLEKYNHPDAMQSFQDALAIDDQWAPALVGTARALQQENPPAARTAAERALGIDPANADARLFLAEVELGDRNRAAAQEAIDRVLADNPRRLEARSLRAAIAWLEDRRDAFEADVAEVLAINPRYGDVYRIAGSQAARAYRFPEAVDLVRQALTIDPDSTRAHAELGMHLLRTGDEPGARAALERSFADDPFDVVTYNLLEMLDQLDDFETIETGDLVVRLHPDEAPVLEAYVPALAQTALDELSARYGMTVRAPVLVEVFPRHDDFAVRNLGLPGMIGALGACFGQVVTLDSPRARPPGDFNWMSTLWHEMAHVVTLQMSNQRLPRWLSEGISTWEEKRRHPAWGRDQVLEFAAALGGDRLLPLAELNQGFTRPESISLAYFHASMVVEHLVEAYGEPALHALVRAYGDGLETADALARIDLDVDRLQASFDAAMTARFGPLRRALADPPQDLPPDGPARIDALRTQAAERPDSFHLQAALGRALRAADDPAGARAAFERAAALAPMATGPDSPRRHLAALAEAAGDAARAMDELEQVLAYDETAIDAARRLAALADAAGDAARGRLAVERIIEIDPFDPIPHRTLGRLARDAGQPAAAAREFRVALALGPVDRVAAHADLGETLLALGELADARRQAIAALEIAPTYERAQELLLAIVEADR